jgi:MOSC domain-containing protein YiiM
MPINPLSPIKKLMDTLPQAGRVEWIGVRPKRDAPIIEKESVEVSFDGGLAGDRFSGGKGSKRQVTLIQAEHLEAVASMMHLEEVEPSLLRRNIYW